MKTEHEKLMSYTRAATEGIKAARSGKKISDNPYPEPDERHWRWLNGWCYEKSGECQKGGRR